MRAFVAVDASSDAIIVKLQNDILSAASWNPRDIKPVNPSNFHFTIIFLGELSDQAIDNIKQKLAVLRLEPFTITYTGVGAFPKPAHARVVWVGVDSEGVQRLTMLANEVVREMSELGFNPDKPFSAHLTLFRARGSYVNAAEISSKFEGITFGSDMINKVHLKKSELTPSGPIYSNVYTVELKK